MSQINPAPINVCAPSAITRSPTWRDHTERAIPVDNRLMTYKRLQPLALAKRERGSELNLGRPSTRSMCSLGVVGEEMQGLKGEDPREPKRDEHPKQHVTQPIMSWKVGQVLMRTLGARKTHVPDSSVESDMSTTRKSKGEMQRQKKS
jgi:hypothetical protein